MAVLRLVQLFAAIYGAVAFELIVKQRLDVSVPLAGRRQSHTGHSSARIVPHCSSSSLPWVVGCVASGTVSIPFVSAAIKSWYSESLLKPRWTPSNRIFAPTWTILYGLIGLSAHRVSRALGVQSAEMRLAFAHHILNLSWAPIFFGLRMLRAGAVVNILLLISLVRIVPAFAAAVPSAAALLAPYVAWLLFATALNIQICRLNPSGVRST